jgi:formate hydrogenlyase subunit 3/multisubunit Na+/H+ antiporter MnhD subunit
MIMSMSALFTAGLLLLTVSIQILAGVKDTIHTSVAWPLPIGHFSFTVDALSAWFLMTMGLLAACIAPYSVAYMRPFEGREPVHRFGALMCVLLASLVLFVCASDSVMFLIGWESMTLTAFLLVMFHDERPEVRRGAWMYLIATHLATASCLVPLFGLLFSATQTTELSNLALALKNAGKPFLTVLFFLGLVGFGAKAGFFPMHIWLPAAHPVAPTPVSAFLSGVVVKTGIYGLLRLLTLLPPLPAYCGACLLAVGIVSGVMGVLYALAQHELKRLLAYHTIENIGIIAIAIAVGMLGRAANEPAVAALGFAGALLHVTNHALFKGLLFLSAGAVLHGSGTLAIERLGGLAKKTPANALFFLAGAIAICGLPPLNGFVSEWVIYAGLITGIQQDIGASGGVPALGVFALALMGSLALACFAKVFGVVFLGIPRDAGVNVHSTPLAMKLSMSGLAMACVFIGLAPGLWVPLTYGATGILMGLEAEQVGLSFRNVLDIGSRLSVMAALFLAVAGGLALFRRVLRVQGGKRLDTNAVPQVGTWGCGYARPEARMQYTATSFALPLIRAFRGLLWPEYKWVAPAGPFPAKSHVEIHTPDLAEHDMFAPLFRGIARSFAMYRHVTWSGIPVADTTPFEIQGRVGPLRTLMASTAGALRKGTIQVYLSFIVITLIVLFLIEGFSSHRITPPATVAKPRSTVGIGMDQ